jgi:hypothetical protein
MEFRPIDRNIPIRLGGFDFEKAVLSSGARSGLNSNQARDMVGAYVDMWRNMTNLVLISVSFYEEREGATSCLWRRCEAAVESLSF